MKFLVILFFMFPKAFCLDKFLNLDPGWHEISKNKFYELIKSGTYNLKDFVVVDDPGVFYDPILDNENEKFDFSSFFSHLANDVNLWFYIFIIIIHSLVQLLFFWRFITLLKIVYFEKNYNIFLNYIQKNYKVIFVSFFSLFYLTYLINYFDSCYYSLMEEKHFARLILMFIFILDNIWGCHKYETDKNFEETKNYWVFFEGYYLEMIFHFLNVSVVLFIFDLTIFKYIW